MLYYSYLCLCIEENSREMTILYDFPGNNRRLYELFSHFILLSFRILFFFRLYFSCRPFLFAPKRANKSDHAQCVYIECLYYYLHVSIYIYCNIYSPKLMSVRSCVSLFFVQTREENKRGRQYTLGRHYSHYCARLLWDIIMNFSDDDDND